MKRFMLTVAAALLSLPTMADEGMWLLPLMKQQKYADMQALGLRLADTEVYNLSLIHIYEPTRLRRI